MLEAYLKQEMVLTATNDILDENNLMQMHNQGRHGDIILYASEDKAPMMERVGKHMFVGVAGINKIKEKAGYFTEITVFDNKANLLDRTRVDNRKINY